MHIFHWKKYTIDFCPIRIYKIYMGQLAMVLASLHFGTKNSSINFFSADPLKISNPNNCRTYIVPLFTPP
jgi:hypothetical protein